MLWEPDFEIRHGSNCSLEIIEFWNRVLPNVDQDYNCFDEEPEKPNPTFITENGNEIVGRQIQGKVNSRLSVDNL